MPIPDHYSPVMPYFIVSDAEAFIAFLTVVFDAAEILRVNADDGSAMHCEYSINGGTVMFGQSSDEWKPAASSVYVVTDAVDETYRKALETGSSSLQEPGDRGYGRAAGFEDKFGNLWWLNTPGE